MYYTLTCARARNHHLLVCTSTCPQLPTHASPFGSRSNREQRRRRRRCLVVVVFGLRQICLITSTRAESYSPRTVTKEICARAFTSSSSSFSFAAIRGVFSRKTHAHLFPHHTQTHTQTRATRQPTPWHPAPGTRVFYLYVYYAKCVRH